MIPHHGIVLFMQEPAREEDITSSSSDPAAAEREAAALRSIRRTKRILAILLPIILILGVYIYIQTAPPPNGMYDAFAQCIAKTTTTFYGAWWCPHCAAQKTEFGDAAKYLPYVECANPDQSENKTCIDKGITAYPTWYFPDGTSSTGVNSLANLAKQTGCALPTST